MTITKPLQEIMKKRKLILRDLYFKINKEISLSRLSDIRLARVAPNKSEIEVLDKYLNLTEQEIEDLEDMKIDILLKEHNEKINNLIALVPNDLKAGESIVTICPNCGSELSISRASLNGHLWIVCKKEGVLICQ